jgi:hypothetical protein
MIFPRQPQANRFYNTEDTNDMTLRPETSCCFQDEPLRRRTSYVATFLHHGSMVPKFAFGKCVDHLGGFDVG